MAAYTNLILAIPHSKGEFDSSLWSDPELVRRDAHLWTDWHTDKLFSLDGMTDSRIRRLIGTVSRFDCDLERLEDDPLESQGQGRLYRRSHSGATRATIPPERAAAWLSLWAEWRVAARYFSLDCQRPLLIDCHSFPSAFAPDVDFCIGYNDDATRPPDEVLAIVCDVIEASGFRASFNAPYSNALAPDGLRGHSLMIEVNKARYMDEQTLQPLDGSTSKGDSWSRATRMLRTIYFSLLVPRPANFDLGASDGFVVRGRSLAESRRTNRSGLCERDTGRKVGASVH